MDHEPFSSPDEFQRFVDVCRRFEEDLRNGLSPSIDEEVAKWPEPLHVLHHPQQELLRSSNSAT